MDVMTRGKTARTDQHTPSLGIETLQKVAKHMARRQVAGLPRNYELFYESMFGHDPALGRDLEALGSRPSQLHLDQLGLKYRLVSHCGLAEEKIQRDAVTILKNLSDMLASGIERKQTFVRSLDMIANALREDEQRSLASLIDELDFLNASATELGQAELGLAETLKSGLAKIETAEKAAKQAHEAALRDRLTGLPNRVAMTRRLEDIYGAATQPRIAVVAAEADDLDSIRRQYGEDAANRMLKRLAAIFRKTIKKNDFVARNDDSQFLFIFHEVDQDDVVAIGERLRHAVETNLIYAAENELNGGGVQLAVGYSLADNAVRPDDLLAQAEHALKGARQESRNPIMRFGR
ncbi:GGDEF domain-containing protein [Ciceribacter sp. L1K22]|uniref:GGDEF domain-containing protein n=1 Tax=Ciceribacter sp. L1K22 TaxID=2820275 RepID=UPI001ABEE1FF|nr:GGDEF domain-containing protein [Ciceribacter sp. L1K22]MBO3759707.1 GGDEF domain-containing protein [Ciceribacter sp. L1K22]